MYLYAITNQPEEPVPPEPGLEGASLLSLAYQDIAAVASPLTIVEVPPTEDNLWRHETIVEALMADRTVLPVRFGTVLADEAAIRAVLAAHHTDFVANLERVRGRVELGLRVLWISDFRFPIFDCRLPITQSQIENRKSKIASGRAYLMARLEEEHQRQAWRQRAEALVAELHTPLAQLATESTRQVLITPRLLLTAAYLVERDQVAAFRQEVEVLSAAYLTLRFLCTGPWPPYNFVSRFPIDDLRFSI
ncbi:MAG: GvpL/GvpF family gas vesicle protein [Anaerolineae bacterium]